MMRNASCFVSLLHVNDWLHIFKRQVKPLLCTVESP